MTNSAISVESILQSAIIPVLTLRELESAVPLAELLMDLVIRSTAKARLKVQSEDVLKSRHQVLFPANRFMNLCKRV